jgi:hypothetical protein
MDNDSPIPAASLEEVRPHARVVIHWRGPGNAESRVHIKGQPPERDETHAWRVPPDEAKALWAALDRLRLESAAPGDVALHWREESPTPESAGQRNLREALHRAGHAEASVASTALHAGQALAGAGRLDDAIAMYRFGIAELGDRYTSPELIDDTESKLILAQHVLAAGKTAQAAALLERVLESRTAVYAKRFGAH